MARLPEQISKAQYLELYRDDELWGPAIEAIASAHGLGELTCSRIPYGSSIVYALGESWIVKLCCPLWREEFEIERALGRALESMDGGEVELPRVRFVGELEGWPYLIMDRVEGVPACEVWSQVSEPERVKIARALGQLMAQLQTLSLEQSRGTLWEQGEQWRASAVSHALERFARKPELRAWMEVISPWLEAWSPPASTQLIHADLTDDNILLAQGPQGWHVSVIDFGDAMLGSPLYEACVPAAFLFHGQRAPLMAMLEAAGVDLSDETWRQELTRCVVTHRYCDPSWMLEQLGLKKQARPQVRALVDALCGSA